MSDFDPSPRSSKRRKPAANVTDSAKPDKSPSSLRSISRTARAISQPLFKPINRDDGVSLGDTSPVVRYSTYKPREDDQGRPELVTGKAIVQDRGSSESADELAQSEVTVTPTKSERTAPRRKIKTPKAVGQVGRIGDADQKSDSSPIRTRTSGRGRKQPRRYSSNWEDSSKPTLPKGILTPSKKSNKGPRKSVVFEQNGSEVMDDLGFKDVDQTAQERTPRSSRKSNPKFSDEAQGQLVNPTLQGVTGEDEAEEGFVEDMTVPEPPENAVSLLMKPTSANKDSRLDVAKSIVLSRLTGESRTPLINLEVEYNKLHSLLLATIKAGEGNSILLLGSRGSGKTCLVESAIAELRIENGADFHVVRLDGFLQTDDKLALREIWRQLGREMQIQEDETAQISSYADTMASLLHLLSHPEEWAETADAHAATRTTKSVIFVLDEFDLFTTHPRQTLLYNLFDIAQARKAPIAVVGCSARIDVGDHLEKRVKSRFSHRWIHLSQAKSFPAFQDIAKAGLMLRAEDIHDLGHDFPKMRSDWNAYIEERFLPSDLAQRLLKQVFYTTKSIPDLFSSLYLEVASISSLDDTSPNPAGPSFLQPPDSVLNMLPHLPTLHLCLVIAAARLDAIHNATVVTFSLVYDHYVDLVSRARLQASSAGSIAQATKLWNRDVAARAWEELAEWEIILAAAGKGSESGPNRMWRCDVVLEEIIGAGGGGAAGMNSVMIRWCKEI